jgi:hypothetical protein
VASEGSECLSNGEASLDGHDDGCFGPALALLLQIGGCVATDNDFDGCGVPKLRSACKFVVSGSAG